MRVSGMASDWSGDIWDLESWGGSPIGAGSDDAFGTFHVKTPNHFLWQGLGVTDGQPFAENTVGHESDVRVATLEAFRNIAGHGVPDGATPPVEPPGITTLALATFLKADIIKGDSIIAGDAVDYFF